MLEKELERMFVKAVNKKGGFAFKFISPGINGVPDRLVVMSSGKVGFVEVKAYGRKLRPLQIKRRRQLESLGALVYKLDHPNQIESIVNAIEQQKKWPSDQ